MSRRALTAAAALVVAGAFAVHECAGSASAVDVRVNGRAVVVSPRSRVMDALRAAHLRPHDGGLRAVVTHGTLTTHWRRARVVLDGRRVGPAARVRAGDRIRLINGTDAVEPTIEREIVVPSAGGALPDVEREVWTPPTNGMVRQTLGARSGQLVGQITMRPAVPASRVPGQVIALSFDDGPDPTFTPQVLQILASAGVKATFCLIGRQARRYPDLVRIIAAQGHALCDHTETHPHLGRLAADQIDAQITPPAQFIQTVTGQAPAFVRPPWGDVNPNVIAIAHQRGMRVLGWTIDTSDYLKPDPAVLVTRVLTAAQSGRIVLMHDGGGDRSRTVAALPTIINQLKAEGYTFVAPPTASDRPSAPPPP